LSDPLVSILIPSFNAERFLPETIESALKQSWPRTEIIIVDDGSTDDSLRVARHYECERLKVVSQENRGGSAARNRALSLAQGDYIQWLDADDLLHPDKIKLQMQTAEALENRRILLTGPFGIFAHRPWKASFSPTALWRDHLPVEWLMQKFINYVYMNPAVWLVSRELTSAAGDWDEALSRDQDGEYVCRIVSKSTFVKYVPGATSLYRVIAGNTVSRASSWTAYDSIWRSTLLCMDYLLEMEHSERTRSACVTYLKTWLPHFYPEFPSLMAKIQEKAEALGATLDAPELPGKYKWISSVVGAPVARKLTRVLPACKWTVIETFDRLASGLSRGSIPQSSI
jgi:glycosyltransferase involved in cell wall biosynthesis